MPERAAARSLPLAADPRRKWLRFLVWEIPILAITGILFSYWRSRPIVAPEIPPRSVSLAVIARPGQLRVEWDSNAPVIKSAAGARIEIVDGIQSRSVTLLPALLAAGSYVYEPQTNDVRVRMIVPNTSQGRADESVRFLGDWPKADVSTVVPAQLEAEARRLRDLNRSQAQRIQDLERSLSDLEKKLDISAR